MGGGSPRSSPYEDWELDDPKGQNRETVRRIVDEVGARIQALVQELTSD